MTAIPLNKVDQGPVLILAQLEKLQPGLGEILIQVHAAGVAPTESLWRAMTHTKAEAERMRGVPGHEFSGVITAIGKDVQDFEIGDEVYGMVVGFRAIFWGSVIQNSAVAPSANQSFAAGARVIRIVMPPRENSLEVILIRQ